MRYLTVPAGEDRTAYACHGWRVMATQTGAAAVVLDSGLTIPIESLGVYPAPDDGWNAVKFTAAATGPLTLQVAESPADAAQLAAAGGVSAPLSAPAESFEWSNKDADGKERVVVMGKDVLNRPVELLADFTSRRLLTENRGYADPTGGGAGRATLEAPGASAELATWDAIPMLRCSRVVVALWLTRLGGGVGTLTVRLEGAAEFGAGAAISQELTGVEVGSSPATSVLLGCGFPAALSQDHALFTTWWAPYIRVVAVAPDGDVDMNWIRGDWGMQGV